MAKESAAFMLGAFSIAALCYWVGLIVLRTFRKGDILSAGIGLLVTAIPWIVYTVWG